MLDDPNFLQKHDKRNVLALIGGWPSSLSNSEERVWLEDQLVAWVATSPAQRNLSKQISRELAGFKLELAADPDLEIVLPHWRNGMTDQPRLWVSRSVHLGIAPSPNEPNLRITPMGKTHRQQQLWLTLLGEYASAYLACLNGAEPKPLLEWPNQ